MGELEQLPVHDLVEAVETGDSVAERENRADLVHADLRVVVLYLLPQQLRNFICFDLSHSSLSQLMSCASVRESSGPMLSQFP